MISKYTTICIKCGRTMRPEKTGAIALECCNAEKTDPYQLWRCDTRKCPECGFEVISGWGNEPYSKHFESDFAEILAEAEATGELIKFY